MIYLHGNSSSRVEALTIVEYLLPNNIAVCGIDLSGNILNYYLQVLDNHKVNTFP